jgi:hypothetical protein
VSVDEKGFQETQIHEQQRKRKCPPGHGETRGRVEMTHKQRNNQQKIRNEVHKIPEVVQMAFYPGF